jgi:hypothetical protein
MHAYGSLYLHHLALEGIRLRDGESPERFPTLLANIPPFSRATQDLAGFRGAFEECARSLSDGGWPDFECEVVATIARHAAILGAYCAGTPAFGRERPFWIAGRRLGYESSRIAQISASATAWRLRREADVPSADTMYVWLTLVEDFLADLGPLINDYTTTLSRAT